jgi:hypothetical protein
MATPHLPADAPRVADGRYVLLSRLGEGGMAVVYGAWDQDLRIWRAVKVLLPEHARRRSIRRRFEREARTLMAIRHPNLVRVHEVRADRALPYLVMDLLPGGSLEDWSHRNGPMPPRMAVDAAVQVCLALGAAHGAGVIHRDVKPQNVLVDGDDACRLTDFGVARVEGGGDTRTNVSMGTVGYMAPEQLADSRSVDVRSDIYSVGASLYVLLTRRSVRDLFRIADEPSLLDGLSPPLRAVLVRCLAYDRQDRWGTARELGEALTEARGQLPEVPDGTPRLARTSPDDRPGGGSPGEFTELEGLLEAPIPESRRGARRPKGRPDPDTEETPVQAPAPMEAPWLAVRAPVAAVVQVEPTYVSPTPPVAPGRGLRGLDTPTPAPGSGRSGLTPRAAALGTASVALMLAGGGLLVGLVGVGLLAAQGELQVSEGADKAAAAGHIVTQRVRDGARLVEDLERLGADAGAARLLLGGDELAFARAVAAAAGPVTLSRREDADDELSRQRLERVVWAVDHLRQAEAGWAEAAQSGSGQLAVSLGLADAPD